MTIKLGVYYYVWYQAGLGTLHWGANCHNPVPIKPQLGYYDSSDPIVIDQHVKWMKQASIDFAIVSHFGDPSLSTDPSFPVIDKNAKAFCSLSNFPFVMLIDYPSSKEPKNIDYIYNNFVTQFPNNYMKGASGKPMLFYYVAPQKFNDSRFEEVYVEGPVKQRGYLDLVPGYNDSFVCGRTPLIINRSLMDYSNRFASNYAKYQDYFAITSFNEWGELSSLEPSVQWGTEYLDQTALLKALPPPTSGGDGLLVGVAALIALAAIGAIALGDKKR